MEPNLADWVQKGGAFAVISLLLYFYRRDWKTLTEYWQQQNTLLMQIVQTNTKELAENQEAVRLMHAESKLDSEAVRTRIHELVQPLATISTGVSLLVEKRMRKDDPQPS